MNKAPQGLLALGIHRPVGMAMIVLAVSVFGVVSLGKLPVDLLPPINYPSLVVRTSYEGAAPEDLEERVTERLEDALATVGGLVRMHSSSRAEISEITLEFEWGANLPFLVQDVRERLDRVFLPDGVDRPLILRYDPSLDPILRVALSGSDDLVRLRDTAEREIERELEGIPGVAAVKVRGGLEDEVQIRLDPQRLAAYQVSSQDVLQRLQEENLNVPGGTLEEGAVEYVVRTLNEFRTLGEIEDLPIVVRGDRFIKLRDLGFVARTHKDRDVVLRVAGAEAVEVDVFREAGANIVETAKLVKDRLFGSEAQKEYWEEQAEKAAKRAKQAAEQEDDEEDEAAAKKKKSDDRLAREALIRERMSNYIERKLPSDLQLTLLSDQANFVSASIDEVRTAGIVGGALAILVCYLFLGRLSATFVVGLSIPISVVATFGPMYLSGVSLNVMSLGGLALGIGMLVDNTIVVLESIARCRDEGDSPLQAALRGVQEVGGAVTASTLTTIAVFAPIVFVEGVAGQTFGDQALTVVASLGISLAVALYFIPGIAARLDRGRSRQVETNEEASAPDHSSPASRWQPGKLGWWFGGFRFPKKRSHWVLSIVLLLIALSIFGYTGLLAEQLEELEDKSGEAVVEQMRSTEQALMTYSVVGSALFLAGGWWLAEMLFVLQGRLLIVTGLLCAALIRWIAIALFATLTVLLRPLSAGVGLLLGGIQRMYPPLLRAALHAPSLVVIAAAVCGFLAWRSVGNLGRELLPEVYQSELTAELIFPAGSPLNQTDLLATRIEEKLREVPGVVESAVVSGADRESISTDEEGPHTARILIRTETGEGARDIEAEVEAAIRAELSKEISLAKFNIRRPTLLALHAPLEIEVLGENLEEIQRLAKSVESELRSMDRIVDVRTSVRRGNPEVLVSLDRERLAEHNLQLAEVARRLRIAVEGEVSSTFPGPDQRIDIRVRADLSQMQHVDQLRDLPVNPTAERPIPLGAVADFRIADGPSEIRHVGNRRAAVLSASTGGFDLGGVTDRVEERLATVPHPPTVDLQVGGQKAEMEASLRSLLLALSLAVFLVYAVMAAQFESFVQPLLIMFSVPLAAVGAVAALAMTGTPVSVVALLGSVILAGIVVNNAIVLVDRINRNRQAGLELEEAIVEAGKTRLRPILMTTVTTVLGMIPLTGWLQGLPLVGSIGAAQGTELRAPMALVVISGLTVSTVLTLLVIPTGYRILAALTPKERSDG